MNHNTLANYYEVIRAMKRHGYSITEVEDLIPFERDLYVMGINHDMNKEQNERQEASKRYYDEQVKMQRQRAAQGG